MSPSRTTKKTKVRFSPTPQVIITTTRPRERKVRFDVESHSDSELEFMMRTPGVPSATASTSTSSGSDDDTDHHLVACGDVWHPALILSGGTGNRTGKEKEKHPYANAKTRWAGKKKKSQVDVESNIETLVRRLQRECQVTARVDSSSESSFSDESTRDTEDDAMS